MFYLKATTDGVIEKASSSSTETTDPQEAKVRKMENYFYLQHCVNFDEMFWE